VYLWKVYYEPVSNYDDGDKPEVKEHIADVPALFAADALEEVSTDLDIHEDDLNVAFGAYLG
jgi:hypothetical protein